MKKIILITTAIILLLVICLVVLFVSSPKPTAMLIHKMFEGGVAVRPDNYDAMTTKTIAYEDIAYDSLYKKGELDVIMPKEAQSNLPVIIWVHGGAFLGGDKSDVTEYATQIASEGYVVVNMNYDLAPSSKYPTPLKQLGEVYEFIEANASQYKIDLTSVYFAGDSAGAHIASQFVNVQVDRAYADLIGMNQIVPADTIMGALLFCGPYDVAQFGEISDNFFLSFLFNRIGWAYIGERNWETTEAVKQASMIEYISSDFPSSFITDGNVGSFEEQGMALSRKLKSKGTYIEDVFYSVEEAELGHEYQFVMNTPQAENTYNKLIEFLARMSMKK